LKRHYEARAKIVAEAQEHWDYEKRGDQRIPIEEEVLEYDENGEEVIVRKRKLTIPELRMKVLDLRDEATQRQFLQALKQQGVPIPDQDIAMGMHYDFEEALGRSQEEMIQKTVAQQEAKVKTYDILMAKGLPVPQDLRMEVEAAQHTPGEETTLGITPPAQGESIVMPPPPGGTPAIGPRNPQRGQRPEESDERAPIPPPGQVPNPTLPGVPGQPGMLGIPGAPTPAIGPAGPGGMARSSEDDGGQPIFELPRKKASDFSIPKLHGGAEDATMSEGNNEDVTMADSEESEERDRTTSVDDS
jgi:hypothetical protein